MRKELKEFFSDFARLSVYATQIGFAIVFSILIGLAIGYYLDKWLKVTWPWLTLIFLIFGVIAGFKNVFIIMNRIQREQKKKGM